VKRLYVWALCVACWLLLAVAPAHAAPGGGEVREVYQLLNAWQFGAARVKVEAIAAASPGDPVALMLQAQVAFYDGDYKESLALLDKGLASSPDADTQTALEGFRQLVQDTFEVSKDYVQVLSPDGRFQVRYPKGKDAVLVPYIFESLSQAYDAMSADFGVFPELPVRVEVYPTAEDLARVSPLTVEDIQTSGTIALCKYNRLMLTSPLALARGYGWIDTLTHEYVHMVINIAGKGQVPIWLHEGLAKFSERRWRGGDGERRMSPYSEYILHKRALEGKIVTFAQMHPSMAKLPSQEDAAMAFAEVYAAMELIHQRKGVEGLSSLVRRVGDGEEVEAAVAGVLGVEGFEGFIAEWEVHMRGRARRYAGDEPPDVYEQVSFRKRASVGEVGAKAEGDADLALITERSAKEWIHLGELLRAKGRPQAAAVEYRKAANVLGDANPVLQARLGRALLDAGLVVQSVEELQKAQAEGEAYGTLFVYLGEALVAAGRWDDAEAALRHAIAQNPYDPAIHRALARIYDERGQTDAAATAREHLSLVSGR
jgi:tetratricopeptide (TPR) repeat protein